MQKMGNQVYTQVFRFTQQTGKTFVHFVGLALNGFSFNTER